MKATKAMNDNGKQASDINYLENLIDGLLTQIETWLDDTERVKIIKNKRMDECIEFQNAGGDYISISIMNDKDSDTYLYIGIGNCDRRHTEELENTSFDPAIINRTLRLINRVKDRDRRNYNAAFCKNLNKFLCGETVPAQRAG